MRICSTKPLKPKKCRIGQKTDAAISIRQLFYQTWQALALTIFWPGLQPKALAKSALFCTEPLVLYSPGECGSVLASRRELSGVEFEHQTWAKPIKKRCSGVKPSFSCTVLASLAM